MSRGAPEVGLLDELTAHLGQGRMDGASMARIARLAGHVPAGPARAGGEMWRALSLPPAAVERLRAGETIEMDPRPYECWSRSRLAVSGLLRLRGSESCGDPFEAEPRMAVLLRRDVPGDLCVLDMEALYRDAGGPLSHGSWLFYAGREREVVLAVPEGRVRIYPEDLAGAWAGDDPDLWRPVLGESFLGHDDEVLEIEECLGANDCGCFEVRAGDRIYPLFPDPSGFVIGGAVRDMDEEMTP